MPQARSSPLRPVGRADSACKSRGQSAALAGGMLQLTDESRHGVGLLQAAHRRAGGSGRVGGSGARGLTLQVHSGASAAHNDKQDASGEGLGCQGTSIWSGAARPLGGRPWRNARHSSDPIDVLSTCFGECMCRRASVRLNLCGVTHALRCKSARPQRAVRAGRYPAGSTSHNAASMELSAGPALCAHRTCPVVSRAHYSKGRKVCTE